MTKPRPTAFQWQEIDQQICAGQLSLRTIASDAGLTEGALRKRIKSRGLIRDLGKRVAARVEEKLIQAVGEGLDKAGLLALKRDVRTATEPDGAARSIQEALEGSENQRVEVAATAIAGILGRQRREASAAKRLVEQLIGDLAVAAAYRVQLESWIDQETEGDRTPAGRLAMKAAVALPTHAKAAQQLITSLKMAQEIESRAWGIASGTTPPPDRDAGEAHEAIAQIKALAMQWKGSGGTPA